jgi:hypothetical protein
MILSNKKSKAVFEKTVLPRRSAQAALKMSCSRLQFPAVIRVIRQFCKRYSIKNAYP